MRTAAEVQAEIDALNKRVESLNAELKAIRVADCPVKVGDRVMFQVYTNREPRLGIVKEVIPRWDEKFEYEVSPMLKAGNFGKPVRLYGWSKIEKEKKP